MKIKVLVYEDMRNVRYTWSFNMDEGEIVEDRIHMNEFCDFCRCRYGDISMIDVKTVEKCLEEYSEERPDIVQMPWNRESPPREADVLEAKARQDDLFEAKMLKSRMSSSSSSSGRRGGL